MSYQSALLEFTFVPPVRFSEAELAALEAAAIGGPGQFAGLRAAAAVAKFMGEAVSVPRQPRGTRGTIAWGTRKVVACSTQGAHWKLDDGEAEFTADVGFICAEASPSEILIGAWFGRKDWAAHRQRWGLEGKHMRGPTTFPGRYYREPNEQRLKLRQHDGSVVAV